MMRGVLAALIIFSLVPVPPSEAAKKKTQGAYVTAKGAVLINGASGKRLFAKDADKFILPASTTKVMTALLVLEKLSLDDYVTVSERATYVPPSRLNLKPGEKYKVRDLLYGLLLNSANDASVVFA